MCNSTHKGHFTSILLEQCRTRHNFGPGEVYQCDVFCTDSQWQSRQVLNLVRTLSIPVVELSLPESNWQCKYYEAINPQYLLLPPRMTYDILGVMTDSRWLIMGLPARYCTNHSMIKIETQDLDYVLSYTSHQLGPNVHEPGYARPAPAACVVATLLTDSLLYTEAPNPAMLGVL